MGHVFSIRLPQIETEALHWGELNLAKCFPKKKRRILPSSAHLPRGQCAVGRDLLLPRIIGVTGVSVAAVHHLPADCRVVLGILEAHRPVIRPCRCSETVGRGKKNARKRPWRAGRKRRKKRQGVAHQSLATVQFSGGGPQRIMLGFAAALRSVAWVNQCSVAGRPCARPSMMLVSSTPSAPVPVPRPRRRGHPSLSQWFGRYSRPRPGRGAGGGAPDANRCARRTNRPTGSGEEIWARKYAGRPAKWAYGLKFAGLGWRCLITDPTPWKELLEAAAVARRGTHSTPHSVGSGPRSGWWMDIRAPSPFFSFPALFCFYRWISPSLHSHCIPLRQRCLFLRAGY
jgi:hypothetical protein